MSGWSSARNVTSIYYTSSPKFRNHLRRGHGNILRARRQGRTRVELLYSWTHSSWYYLDKIKPVSILALDGKGFMRPSSSWETKTGSRRGSYLFLTGWPVSSRWPHNQEYMDSTNMTVGHENKNRWPKDTLWHFQKKKKKPKTSKKQTNKYKTC